MASENGDLAEGGGEDRSGAVAWAKTCANSGGQMRSWIDSDGHACVGSHSFGPGCDVMLWTASLVLLHYLDTQSGIDWRGKRVLELSAGTGHLAVGLTRLGGHVTATECTSKHDPKAYAAMTTLAPHLLRERRDGAGCSAAPPYSGGPCGGELAFRALDWGAAEDGLGDGEIGRWDVLVLSELVALGDELQESLIETLGRLLGPKTVAYSVFCERPFSMGFLCLLSWDTSFVVEEIEVGCPPRHDETMPICTRLLGKAVPRTPRAQPMLACCRFATDWGCTKMKSFTSTRSQGRRRRRAAGKI